MNILLITESFPFPPKNGRELPTAMIFKSLAKNHKLDMIITSNHPNDEICKKGKELGINVYFIGKKKLKKHIILYNSFISLGKSTLDTFSYDINALKKIVAGKHYDWVWLSPITSYFVISQSQKFIPPFYNQIALGLNDVKTYLYRDSINEILRTKSFSFNKAIRYLRSFFIKIEERNIFKNVNLIHVQTENEKQKVFRVIGKDTLKVVAAPNGKKLELSHISYSGVDSNKIVFMTQMEKGRRNEAKWFLSKVWPIVNKSCPNAFLYLVGAPPSKIPPFIANSPNTIVKGFVPDLADFLKNMTISVVPTFHGTGLINRILDSLCASLPTITTPQAANTFTNLQNGKHVLISEDANTFAKHIINLLESKELRLKYSYEGRSFTENFPDWNQSVNKIEKALIAH